MPTGKRTTDGSGEGDWSEASLGFDGTNEEPFRYVSVTFGDG